MLYIVRTRQTKDDNFKPLEQLNNVYLAALEFMREFDLDQCEHCPYQDGSCLGQCADNIIDENTI